MGKKKENMALLQVKNLIFVVGGINGSEPYNLLNDCEIFDINTKQI